MNETYDRIESLCKKLDVSVTEMCRGAKVARGILTDFKMGRTKKLSTDTLQKIADYFGVSVDYLLTGEEQKNPPAEAGGLKAEVIRLIQELPPEGKAEAAEYIKYLLIKYGYLPK